MNLLSNYNLKKIEYAYSLNSEWHTQFAKEIGGELIRDRFIVFPQSIGIGNTYFADIAPGIAVAFMDFILVKPLMMRMMSSENELYIFHYDLSEACNDIEINKGIYKIGNEVDYNLAILNNKKESSLKPAVGKRTLFLCILVDQNLLNDFTRNYSDLANKEIRISENGLYSIHSNSLLLIDSIKSMSMFDTSFPTSIRGISLKLLSNFFDEYNNSSKVQNLMTKIENEAIIETMKFLANNLRNSFPTIEFLSSMAGMSTTKYKILFKRKFNGTPNNLFIYEKMKWANQLLASGEYNSVTEILYEINYSRLSYFSSRYYSVFQRKPIQDFIKKN